MTTDMTDMTDMIAKMQCVAVRMAFRPLGLVFIAPRPTVLTNSLRSLPVFIDVDDPIYAIRRRIDEAKSVESSVVKA